MRRPIHAYRLILPDYPARMLSTRESLNLERLETMILHVPFFFVAREWLRSLWPRPALHQVATESRHETRCRFLRDHCAFECFLQFGQIKLFHFEKRVGDPFPLRCILVSEHFPEPQRFNLPGNTELIF
jgi:hypothetical protein